MCSIRSLSTASNASFRADGCVVSGVADAGSLFKKTVENVFILRLFSAQRLILVGVMKDLSRFSVPRKKSKTLLFVISLQRVLMYLFAEGGVLPLIVTLVNPDCVLSVASTTIYGLAL